MNDIVLNENQHISWCLQKVVFESNVFHPSVDPVSGEAELKSMFPEWRKDVNRLWQVLDHVVQMFCSVRVKNPLHTEAAHL